MHRWGLGAGGWEEGLSIDLWECEEPRSQMDTLWHMEHVFNGLDRMYGLAFNQYGFLKADINLFYLTSHFSTF